MLDHLVVSLICSGATYLLLARRINRLEQYNMIETQLFEDSKTRGVQTLNEFLNSPAISGPHFNYDRDDDVEPEGVS